MLTCLCLLMTHLAQAPLQPTARPVAGGTKQTAPSDFDAPECVVCHVHAIDMPQILFGQDGQWVFGLSNNLLVQGIRVSFGDEVTQDITFGLQMTAAYFVSHHISLGGLLGYARLRMATANPALNTLSVGPQIGYSLALSPHVSFYPTFGVLYGYESDRNTAQRATSRVHSVDVDLEAAFVVRLAEHLSLSVGPFLKQSLFAHRPASLFREAAIAESSSVQTYYGLQMGLLGWL